MHIVGLLLHTVYQNSVRIIIYDNMLQDIIEIHNVTFFSLIYCTELKIYDNFFFYKLTIKQQ